MKSQHSLRRWICFVLIPHLAAAPMVLAQGDSAATQSSAASAATPDKPPLKPEELEQMLAPIALYPDSLLSQIFMASTYPLEVVQADRWATANKDLKGDALAAELEKQPWDPSVKSLVNFPQVLSMMSEKLDLTVKLGDAFIEQQADVMNTVQVLRAKAQTEGNLKTNEQQKIVVEAAPPAAAQTTVIIQQVPAPVQIIRIEPVQPTVIYVPVYNPVIVYGGWPYPAYPPYPYYPPRPPGYVSSSVIFFGVGVACGVAWGYAWGNCNWGRTTVNVNINQNTNINANINRAKYQGNIQNNGNWQHNPAHRQGVPYRYPDAAQKYGGANQSQQAAQARDAYRGRADAGRQDLARGGVDQVRNNSGSGGNGTRDVPAGAGANRGAAGSPDRAGTGAQNRPAPAPANRASTNDTNGAFNGVDRGGGAARTESQRGQSSRSGGTPQPQRSGNGSSGGAGRTGGGGGSGGGGGGGAGQRSSK